MLVAAGATCVGGCSAVPCNMSVLLAFRTADRFTFVLADRDSFVADTNTFFEDEVSCVRVSNVKKGKRLSLGWGSAGGGLDPSSRDY